jgi:hypothetical protein
VYWTGNLSRFGEGGICDSAVYALTSGMQYAGRIIDCASVVEGMTSEGKLSMVSLGGQLLPNGRLEEDKEVCDLCLSTQIPAMETLRLHSLSRLPKTAGAQLNTM